MGLDPITAQAVLIHIQQEAPRGAEKLVPRAKTEKGGTRHGAAERLTSDHGSRPVNTNTQPGGNPNSIKPSMSP
jgi:hypothetical protein